MSIKYVTWSGPISSLSDRKGLPEGQRLRTSTEYIWIPTVEIIACVFAGVAVDAEVTETDLAEELPLCCCRMETPYSGGNLSALDQTCMAMESTDGMVKIS